MAFKSNLEVTKILYHIHTTTTTRQSQYLHFEEVCLLLAVSLKAADNGNLERERKQTDPLSLTLTIKYIKNALIV